MDSGQSVHLVVEMLRDILPAKLKVKNDTFGGFLSLINQLSTLENLQNDSKILNLERVMTDIGALTIWGGSERDMTPHIGSVGSEN